MASASPTCIGVDRRDFHLVGTDGGLLAAPQTLRSIQLSPGERAEIVAAFRPGERAVLCSFARSWGTNFFVDRSSGGDDSFDVLEYGGGPPPPELGGPKDTLYLQPGKTARIATRFGDYADPDHPYMFHRHRLAHEDRGMMGQFVVSG